MKNWRRHASWLGVLALVVVAVACDPVPVTQSRLDIAVSISDDVVVVGEQVAYNLTITNSGADPAGSAALVATLPPGLTYSSATPSQGSCAPASLFVACNIGAVAIGANATISMVLTAQQPGLATTTLQTTDGPHVKHAVHPTIGVIDPPATNMSDTFTRIDSPGLGFTETGSPWSVLAGTWGVSGTQAVPSGGYSLAVAEGGSPVGTFDVTVPAASGEFWAVLRASDGNNYWRFGSDGGQYVMHRTINNTLDTSDVTSLATVMPAAGDVLSCTLTALSIRCSVNGTPVARSNNRFNHTASRFGMATFATGGPSLTRFDDVRFSHPGPTAILELSADASPDVVVGGEQVDIGITISNVGAGTAQNARLDQVLPEQISFESVSTTQGVCAEDQGTVSCELGAMPPNSMASVVVTGTTEPFVGLVSVTSSVFDPPTVEPHDSVGTIVGIVAQPPAGQLADTFSRSDSASLGAADTGQPWTTYFGGWGVFGTRAATSTAGYSLAVADGGSCIGTFEVTVPVTSDEFWILLRASNSTNYWRVGSTGGGPYILQRVQDNNLVGADISTLATVIPAPGDRITCTLSPFSIECAVNAVPVVRTTSEFNRTATLFGIGAYDPVNVPATQYDDLAFAQADPSPLLDLSVLTSADPVTVGQQVAFTMTVTNNGDAPANSVGLDETFPAQISIDSAVPTQGTCTPTVTTVTCELGALAPNNIANVVVTGTVQEQGIARTQATASVNATPHSTVTTAITTLAAIPDPANPDPAVFDTFSGAPQSGLGVADSGHLWLEHVGEWGVDGGHAAQATTGVGIATVDAGGAFGYYDVVVADVVDEFWVVFHLTDELNYWRFGRHAGGEYLLQRVEAGFIQTWGLTFGNATPADGDHIRIVLTSDDGINAYVNGNWIRGTGTLFNMNATRLGVATIRLPGLPSTRFDLVHWTPFTDDFPEPPDPHG